MARTTKKAPQRKPVKARGALPAPRVAPKRRPRVEWHRRRSVRLLAGILILALLGSLISVFLSARQRAEGRERDLRTVTRFEKAVQLLNAPLSDVRSAMNEAPQNFQLGILGAQEFSAQTDIWIEAFRKLEQGLRKRSIPEHLTGLVEARALMVDGALIYIDTAKQFKVAASVVDQAAKDLAIQNGQAMLTHAGAVYGMGQRALHKEKKRLGGVTADLGPEHPLEGPIQLPEENPPPPPPPQFPGAPEGAQPLPPEEAPEELPAP